MKKMTKKIFAIILALTVALLSAVSAYALSRCAECDRLFESQAAYESHVKICNVGASTDAITFICSYCGAVYQTKDMFKAHVESCSQKPATPQQGNVNTCENCGSDFADEHEYNNHIQLCATTYTCSRCGKEFKTAIVLGLHTPICGLLPEIVTQVNIANNPGSTSIEYGETLRLTAEAKNLPAGATLKWYSDGEAVEISPSANGKTCDVKSVGEGSATIMVRVIDKDSNAIKDTTGKEVYDMQVVNSEVNFFLRIISFFKDLFRMDRTIVQVIF